MKKEILSLKDVSYVYSYGTPFEHTALKAINFTLQAGEFVGVIGHTGSGKSSFIQHLNGLLKPTTGQVFFEGKDIHAGKKGMRDLCFSVGLVFQYPEYQLFEETVEKDIAFGPNNMGLGQGEVASRVEVAAKLLGLTKEQLQMSPFLLSGGQKRRASMAGVLAMKPKVLVLDEPTAGLDPKGRKEILAHVKQYQEKEGAAVVMVSHNMDEIAAYADRVLVFSKASIVLEGTPAQVFGEEKILVETGLLLPQAMEIAAHLRKKGLPLSADIFTIEELAKEIISHSKQLKEDI